MIKLKHQVFLIFLLLINNVLADEEKTDSRGLLAISITLIIGIFLTHFFLKLEFQFIPESTVLIFFGIIVGGLIKLSGNSLDDIYKLDSSVFFLTLLPPIIYDSGYNMHKEYFFFNFGSIFVFAVFGTLLSTIVIGIGLYCFQFLSFFDSMMYASLLSAVDPVATLAIFQALNVEPHLNALVFGESILNDAVSIVLFKTFKDFSKHVFSFYLIFEALTHFLMIFFG